ncbi:hypothetical protein [Halioxenophilus aromaticivorans]|uniref:Uncharacterized protein n=1 Tax=Halioxenophilus aromaticivorans TaxID=1306992 RepID=A0AAV3U0X2_9ALTE
MNPIIHINMYADGSVSTKSIMGGGGDATQEVPPPPSNIDVSNGATSSIDAAPAPTAFPEQAASTVSTEAPGPETDMVQSSAQIDSAPPPVEVERRNDDINSAPPPDFMANKMAVNSVTQEPPGPEL